jgi:hypothetical protein
MSDISGNRNALPASGSQLKPMLWEGQIKSSMTTLLTLMAQSIRMKCLSLRAELNPYKC